MPTETPEPQRPEHAPAGSQEKKRKHRRVVRQGTEREAIFGVSTDEKDDAQSNTATMQNRSASPPKHGLHVNKMTHWPYTVLLYNNIATYMCTACAVG